MKITKISPIRGHRIFRNFQWPTALPTFAQYNVIYGWNGAGKSTLSGLFQAMERGVAIQEGEVGFQFGTTTVRGADLGSGAAVPKVRVFSRSFVEDTVFRSAGQGVAPIYFLGQESKEKRQQVEQLRSEIEGPAGIGERKNSANETLQLLETDLDSFCIQQGARIRELLRSGGTNAYNNYDKGSYRRAVEKLLVQGEAAVQEARLTPEAFAELVIKKKASPKPRVQLPNVKFPDVQALHNRAESLLKQTVVSSALSELTMDSGLESWVQRGLALHGIPHAEEHSVSPHCKFCEQPLLPERVAQLEQHFNDHYERFSSELEATGQSVRAAIRVLDFFGLPKVAELGDHLQEKYASAYSRLGSIGADYDAYLEAVGTAIAEKAKHAFQPLNFQTLVAAVAWPDVEAAKTVEAELQALVGQHNDEVDHFEQILGDARATLERGCLAETAHDYLSKKNAPEQLRSEIAGLEEKKRRLEDQIRNLEREIEEHHQAADELNGELRAYLGRDELIFRSQGTGYVIERAGQAATNLSEGERTAIAFLYFLKSLKDKNFDLANGVVVVDDPVSSLDANSLFCAFAYMQKRTLEAGQLFILTHNFAFFRQAKNWLYHLQKAAGRKAPKLSEYFMLDTYRDDGLRAAHLCELDPLLRDYESEYHFLFKKVLEGSVSDQGKALEDYYGLPNLARRLLEAFLGFRFPNTDGLRSKLAMTITDPAKTARIIRFVHTYSHETAGADEHDLTMLAEAPAVLRAILDLIELEDQPHYQQMLALLGADRQSADPMGIVEQPATV